MKQKVSAIVVLILILVGVGVYFLFSKSAEKNIECFAVTTIIKNSKTGEMRTFYSSCIPDGWERVEPQPRYGCYDGLCIDPPPPFN